MIQTGTFAPPVHFNILPAPGFIPVFLWDPCCSSLWLCCFEYYARTNILNTDSSRSWENKFSSTERSDLGDDFCRSLFVLCPLDILLSVRLRFMDYDYLFGIFKLVLHIKSKELLAQAQATSTKFDTTLTSQLGFPDPKYLFFLTFDFKCTQ